MADSAHPSGRRPADGQAGRRRFELIDGAARLAAEARARPVEAGPVTPHPRRAAVCAVLRLGGWQGGPLPGDGDATAADKGPEAVQAFLAEAQRQGARLELLFIKRAEVAGDRWSGHVAFSGGRQQEGESDLQTAERETREEIGVDLSDRSKFTLLTRLEDQPVMALSATASLVVSVFVYLQVVRETPPLRIGTREVADAVWVPLETLAQTPRQWLFLRRPMLPVWGTLSMELPERAPGGEERAPSGTFPPPLTDSIRRAAWSLRSAVRRLPLPGVLRFPALNLSGVRFSRAGAPAEGAGDVVELVEGAHDSSVDATDPAAFVVWGLTLGFTATILARLGFSSLRAEYDLHMVPARRLLALHARWTQLKELTKESWALRSRI